ncbi:hypothetical protein [Methanosarcina horonobensis]|uniref:hypothetical protein n=1 Tax=Methanosarcina horonobensis TaxID=418008 RepID=UPI00064FEFA2|nr:hypothetical protein [Methanosarcina horonobensis]
MIRKNVSLDEVHLQKLQPLLEKNGGNLSAAIREVIDLFSLCPESHETLKETAESLKRKESLPEIREQFLRSGEYVMINQQMMKWLMRSSAGKLIDKDIVHGLINPYLITTISELEEHLNNTSRLMGWKIEVLSSAKESFQNEDATIDFIGGDRDLRELFVKTVCIFLSCWMGLDAEALHRKSNSITVYLRHSARHDIQDITPGVRKHFGSKDLLYREIERKPAFWVTLAELYTKFNYQRVNLDKNLFEALLAGKLPDITKYFEIKADRPLREIPLSELLPLFKYLVVASQLVSDVEIFAEKGKEYIKIRHDYSDECVVLKLIQLFSNLFEAGLHRFSVTYVSGLIIFDFSLPETSLQDAVKVSSDLDF